MDKKLIYEKLYDYCSNGSCVNCKLKNDPWKHLITVGNRQCLDFENASDDELYKAYELIKSKDETKNKEIKQTGIGEINMCINEHEINEAAFKVIGKYVDEEWWVNSDCGDALNMNEMISSLGMITGVVHLRDELIKNIKKGE